MLAKSILISLFFAAAANAQLGISTPRELKQCEQTTLAVTGADGPLYGFVVDAAKPCEDALAETDEFTGDLKWLVTLPVGSTVMFAVEDDEGREAWSGPMTIVAGASDACLTAASASSSSSASTGRAAPTTVPGGVENAIDAPVETGSGASRLATSGVSAAAALFALYALAL